jgi:archaetidylinositol phosphate synthase
MLSYTSAKGESHKVNVSGKGIGERAESIFILAVTSIMGFPYYGVILIVVLASLTFIQRFIYIIKKLEK